MLKFPSDSGFRTPKKVVRKCFVVDRKKKATIKHFKTEKSAELFELVGKIQSDRESSKLKVCDKKDTKPEVYKSQCRVSKVINKKGCPNKFKKEGFSENLHSARN